jgi:hypothetical protein
VFQIPGDYVKHFTQALEHFDGIKTVGAINELDAAVSVIVATWSTQAMLRKRSVVIGGQVLR